MHRDLANRIHAVHKDLQTLIGVLVPDLAQALENQARRDVHMLDIPPVVATRFGKASQADRPSSLDGQDPPPELEELANAFILHFNDSTVEFKAGILVENKIPPVGAYLNLLKCIWLMKQMKECDEIVNPDSTSHWSSYVLYLEDVSDLLHGSYTYTRERDN
jgi:hypothetical protein